MVEAEERNDLEVDATEQMKPSNDLRFYLFFPSFFDLCDLVGS